MLSLRSFNVIFSYKIHFTWLRLLYVLDIILHSVIGEDIIIMAMWFNVLRLYTLEIQPCTFRTSFCTLFASSSFSKVIKPYLSNK